MKPYKNTVKIDADKFRSACHRRGMKLTDASTAIGMSKNYLSARITEGKFPMYVTKLLKAECGMEVSEYEYTEEQMTITGGASNVELYKLVYTATYNACKRALEEMGETK